MGNNYRASIGKMLSLIERMEGDFTPYQALLNEERKIYESISGGIRRLATKEEVEKIINDSQMSWWTTVCYLKVFKPRTMRSIDKDQFINNLTSNRTDNDDEVFDKLSKFHSGEYKKLPFQTIIKITRFQIVWLSANDWDKKYAYYANFVKDNTRPYIMKALRVRLGREPSEGEIRDFMPSDLDPEKKVIDKLNFGTGGKVGVAGNATGKKYIPYNQKSYKTLDEEYYAINEEGRIVAQIPTSVGKMFEPKKSPATAWGSSHIRKAGGSQADIDEYSASFFDMVDKQHFLPANVIEGQVLYLAASMKDDKSGGAAEKLLWYNDALTHNFTHYVNNKNKERVLDYDYHIEKSDLDNIAKQKIQQDYNIMIDDMENSSV